MHFTKIPKHIAALCGLLLLAPLLAHAQAASAPPGTARSNIKNNVAADTAVAKCLGPDGKACTPAHVKDINTGVTTGRRMHQSLMAVKSVTLASQDGTLKCEQNDGTACTAEQVKALNEIAASWKCSINYNSSKSNTGNVTAKGTAAPSKSGKL
jgi:hypothetical protein